MEKEQFKAGGFCDVCKMAVRYVDGILEQNATQSEIEEAVMKVCNFLPDAVRDEVGQTFQRSCASSKRISFLVSILHTCSTSNKSTNDL